MISSVLFLSSALLCAAPETIDNLDFSRKTFAGWGGNGFTLGAIPFKGQEQLVVVTSKEAGATGATGVLYRTIRVPPGASEIRVMACVAREAGLAADDRLDVALL